MLPSISGGFAPKLAPPIVGAQTWVLSAASNGAKSGFLKGRSAVSLGEMVGLFDKN